MIKFKFNGETYGITSDQKQWKFGTIKYHKKQDKEHLDPIGYYTTFSSMVKNIYRFGVRGSEYNTFQELAQVMEERKKELTEALGKNGFTVDV